MKRLFIATSRLSARACSVLVGDMAALGYQVEWDRTLPGGNAWWARTLDEVERADAFVYAVTRASVASSACQEQMEYAFTLDKPVLPVLLEDDVSDVDLPTNLGAIQRVDYRTASSSAMAELFSALRGLPEASATAGTATRPECPLEYTLDIAARMASPTHLTRIEQDSILAQIGALVDAGYSATELEPLLSGLQQRRLDLTVSASSRLDELERVLASSSSTPIALPERAGAPVEAAHVGDPPVRSLFVSYSRSERDLVDHLVADMRRLGFLIWIDQNLPGGSTWWDQVLLNIRESDALVFAAGPASIASRACLAELEYARLLGKPIARFDLGPGELGAADSGALAGISAARYLPDDKPSIAAIATMLTGLSRTMLPPLLPPSPDVPATYTFDVQNQLRSSRELDPADQAELIDQIRRYAEEGVSVGDLGRLLTSFRKRGDITMRSLADVAELEAQLGIAAAADAAHPAGEHAAAAAEAERKNAEAEQARRDAEAAEARRQAEDEQARQQLLEQAEENRRRSEDEERRRRAAEQELAALRAAEEQSRLQSPPVTSPPRRRSRAGWVLLVLLVLGAGAGAAVWAMNRSDSQGGDDPPRRTVVDPVFTVDEPLTTTFDPGVDTFQGVSGQAVVEWEVNGNFHSATIQTSGITGVVDVEITDGTGAFIVVREDLTLRSDDQGFLYEGSSPRFVPGGDPVPDYSEDSFRMTQGSDGLFTFDAVCDDFTGCHPAFTTPL
ncbi:MAG TPA: toll/interleukin-1 receptor domain-containing protein [Ilumatobacteraceae bacterium]|nr:toll/interleukin-1 receptor domain-containing protein [Ilumatobacteraceae bacterium]